MSEGADRGADEIKESLAALQKNLKKLYAQSREELKKKQEDDARQALKIHQGALSAMGKAYERYKRYVESLERETK